MKSLTPTGITEKNALYDKGAWLVMMDVDATALGSTTFHWTSNNVNTTWPTVGGTLYGAMPIEVGDVQESTGSKLPSVMLRVADVERVYAPYLVLYKGLIGAVVRLRVVHSEHLNVATPEVDETFTITDTRLDQQWMEFTLGGADPLGKRFPRDRYVASMCRHTYKGGLCRYVGTEPVDADGNQETTCDHTILDCQLRGNVVQYGGSPGVAEGIYG